MEAGEKEQSDFKNQMRELVEQARVGGMWKNEQG